MITVAIRNTKTRNVWVRTFNTEQEADRYIMWTMSRDTKGYNYINIYETVYGPFPWETPQYTYWNHLRERATGQHHSL